LSHHLGYKVSIATTKERRDGVRYELAFRLAISISKDEVLPRGFKDARFFCDEMLKEDLLLKDRNLVNHLKILVLIEEGKL
jgi:hypothetical protein